MEKTTIEVCKVKNYAAIDKLRLHPDNPRTIKPERLAQLKDSIVKKGFYQPILVWKKGGYILAGNHRLLAVQELIEEGFVFVSPDGKENVLPVVIEDVSEEVANAILFETNNHYADWVEVKVQEALDEAVAKGFNVADWGFDQDYLDNLLAKAEADADEILKTSPGGDKERTIEPVDGTKLRDALGEEEFESLIMPKHIYEEFVGYLQKISRALSDDWKPGDAYTEAMQAMNQMIKESGAVDEIIEQIKAHRGME